MINYLFCILGIIVIGISIFFINKEFKNNTFVNSNSHTHYIKEDQAQDIIESIEVIENIIKDINEYFYNTVTDFEKKHRKLENMIDMLNNKILTNVDKEPSETREQIYHSNENNSSDIDKYLINNKEKQNNVQVKNLHRLKIFELRNKGLNIQQIAKELNIGTGEVQLMLSLNKK